MSAAPGLEQEEAITLWAFSLITVATYVALLGATVAFSYCTSTSCAGSGACAVCRLLSRRCRRSRKRQGGPARESGALVDDSDGLDARGADVPGTVGQAASDSSGDDDDFGSLPSSAVGTVTGKVIGKGVSQEHRRRQARCSPQNIIAVLYVQTRMGHVLDVGQAAASALSCVLYVLGTYRSLHEPAPTWALILDYILLGVFIADYLLRLATARDKVRFVRSMLAIVDFVTVVPVVLQLVLEVQLDARSENMARGMRALRVFRAIRILRMLRLAPTFSLSRALFYLVLAITSIIFCAAGLFQVTETSPDDEYLVPFHSVLYQVTIETIGRPNVFGQIDDNLYSQGLMICLTVVSAGIIPVVFGRAALAWVHQSAISSFKGDGRVVDGHIHDGHVVIAGRIWPGRLRMVLAQLLHSTLDAGTLPHVVVLHPSPMSTELRSLIDDVGLGRGVTYVQGSPRNPADLRRADLARAKTVVLLASRGGRNAIDADMEQVATAMAIKSFSPLTDVVSQMRLPRSKKHMQAVPGWTSRDRAVSIAGMLGALVGVGAIIPGFPTLVLNLVHRGEKSSKAGGEAGDSSACCVRTRRTDKPPARSTLPNYAHDYAHGFRSVVQVFMAGSAMNGLTFRDTAAWAYQAAAALMFAHRAAKGAQFVLFPQDTVIRTGDRIYFVATCPDSLHRMHSCSAEAVEATVTKAKEALRRGIAASGEPRRPGIRLDAGESKAASPARGNRTPLSSGRPPKPGSAASSGRRGSSSRGGGGAARVDAATSTESSHRLREPASPTNSTEVTFTLPKVGRLKPSVMGMPRNHVLICGAPDNLALFVKALGVEERAAYQQAESLRSQLGDGGIVVLAPVGKVPVVQTLDIEHGLSGEWIHQIRWMDGSPHNVGHLKMAGIDHARSCIILPGANDARSKVPIAAAAKSAEEEHVVESELGEDAPALVVANIVHRMAPWLHTVTLLQNGSSAAYVPPTGTSMYSYTKPAAVCVAPAARQSMWQTGPAPSRSARLQPQPLDDALTPIDEATESSSAEASDCDVDVEGDTSESDGDMVGEDVMMDSLAEAGFVEGAASRQGSESVADGFVVSATPGAAQPTPQAKASSGEGGAVEDGGVQVLSLADVTIAAGDSASAVAAALPEDAKVLLPAGVRPDDVPGVVSTAVAARRAARDFETLDRMRTATDSVPKSAVGSEASVGGSSGAAGAAVGEPEPAGSAADSDGGSVMSHRSAASMASRASSGVANKGKLASAVRKAARRNATAMMEVDNVGVNAFLVTDERGAGSGDVVHGETARLPPAAHITPEDVFAVPSFASGRAVAATALDMLVAEAHHTAYASTLVKKMLRAAKGNRVRLLRIPKSRAFSSFGDLFHYFLYNKNVLMLGVYREVLKPSAKPTAWTKASPAPESSAPLREPSVAGEVAGGLDSALNFWSEGSAFFRFVFTSPLHSDTPLASDLCYVLLPPPGAPTAVPVDKPRSEVSSSR